MDKQLIWLPKFEEKWPEPYWQESEVSAEPAITIVAMKVQVNQLRLETPYQFNPIKNIFAYCIELKKKQRGLQKEHELLEAKQISLRIDQNWIFKYVSKSVASCKELSKSLKMEITIRVQRWHISNKNLK